MINLKDKREKQKRETWIKNVMAKLFMSREQAEAAWHRIHQTDHYTK